MFSLGCYKLGIRVRFGFSWIGYRVWSIGIGGREAWLVRVIIMSLNIHTNKKVCVYVLHALHLCFTC